MTTYLLDTNTVSHLLRSHVQVSQRIQRVPMGSLGISAITEGELLFGLALRPAAHRLHRAVQEFLRRVDVLPWDSAVAARYGMVRAGLSGKGKAVAPLDLLIGCHALALGRVLVSSDRAFRNVEGLMLEDWAESPS